MRLQFSEYMHLPYPPKTLKYLNYIKNIIINTVSDRFSSIIMILPEANAVVVVFGSWRFCVDSC